MTTHTVTVDGFTIPISAPYTRVTLDETDPCFEVSSFCDQGVGAPLLEFLAPQDVDTLHFLATGAAPDAPVALIGGQRGRPMSVPAGSMCIGSGRRVLAVGQAGFGGTAQISWSPGAAGATALSSGQFAVQAASQGAVMSLSNALAIQTRPEGWCGPLPPSIRREQRAPERRRLRIDPVSHPCRVLRSRGAWPLRMPP